MTTVTFITQCRRFSIPLRVAVACLRHLCHLRLDGRPRPSLLPLQLLFEDLQPSVNTSEEIAFLDHAGSFVQQFVGDVTDVDPHRVTGLVFANGTQLPGEDIVALQLVGAETSQGPCVGTPTCLCMQACDGRALVVPELASRATGRLLA